MVSEGEAFPSFLHNKCRDALGANVRRRHSKDHIGVSLTAVGDKDFFAVEQVVIAFQHRCGLSATGIRTRIGLRQAKCAQLFSPAQRNQIFLFLLLCAISKDRPGSQ